MCRAIFHPPSGIAILPLLLSIYAFPQAASEVQKHWGVYWTTAPGFTSSLEMKNNLVSDPLTVAISVYVAAGEFPVKTITLAPRQTTVLDLNSAIQATAVPRDAREGTLEVEFTGPNPSALMGSISVTNLEQGIAWNFFLYPRRTDAEAEAAPLRSVFWLPGNQADGFVAGQNVSESNLTLTPVFQIEGRNYPLAAIVLGPEQGFKLELRNELRRLGLANVRAGGIQLSYQGEPDGLKAHGVLFDGNGFSAEMDFLRYQQADPGQTFYLRTPRFAIGPADAKLGLPAGTTFGPTLLLHNFRARTLNTQIAVGIPKDGGVNEVKVPVLLAPGKTVVLPLAVRLAAVRAPQTSWASLEISYLADSNDLTAALVSVSQDGRHSLRSVLNWVEGSSREGWYWQADATHDTFINLLNTDTNLARVEVSLDYAVNGEQKTYILPERRLPPRSSASVDVGEIISQGQADAEGNVIPSGVDYGGYHVRKLGLGLGATLTTEALVFDRERQNFLTIYNTCCGINGGTVHFDPSQFLGPPGPIGNFLVQGTDYCSGQTVDLTPSSTFSSNNASVATVNTAGAVTGVSPGGTNSNGFLTYSQQKTVDTCITKNASSAKPTYVGAVPVNFRLVGAQDVGNGDLDVTYTWDSSTGNRADLSSCTIGEYVTYPTPPGIDYQPPSPPWPVSPFMNPTVVSGSAVNAAFVDHHWLGNGITGASFKKPYSASSFPANQYYWYQCGGSNFVHLKDNLVITRSVSTNGAGGWKFTCSSSDTATTATINPLP